MKWLFFVAMPFVFVVCSDQQAGLVSDDLIPAKDRRCDRLRR
jgi:hypothetical protein